MEFASEKWGGVPHYRGDVRLLGHDEHGAWWWGDLGGTIWRGQDPLFTREQDLLLLVPEGAWWSASWWIGHAEVELYVNINLPAVHEAERFVVVDLDLDVIRWVDGRVEVVDRDEFEEHQVRFGYPPDVIERTERVTAEVHAAVAANRAPFDAVAAAAWIRRARTDASP